jgi:tRNA A-37 threonylcarbamoyl transferase component Bud32/tetratricopeptide (TPR) repeat protein
MIGKVVSHYKILEHLGGGGMGVVYKARDLKLDRNVALKFLPPDLTRDPEARLRFIHEAKAASALQHECICVIHDIDRTADGRTFMVLEYYEGWTIKKEIARGALPVDKAMDITIQVGEGLAEAHRHGIVHRDIKPANIMLTEQGKARIVDFGVALLRGETRLTVDGHRVGTVTHMSPEQARGDPVDHRTDIWSLGVLLYEMIAGRLPFESSYEQAIVYSILNVDPPPLSSSRPEVPGGLDEILWKALAKDTGSRYQNIEDMVEDLRRITGRSTGPASARRPRGIYEMPARRRWRIMGASAATLILALAGVWLLQGPRPAKNAGVNHVTLRLRTIRSESSLHRVDEWARLAQNTYLPNKLAGKPDILVYQEGSPGAEPDFDLNGEIVGAESAFVLQVRLQEPETGRLRYAEAASFTRPDELEKAASRVAGNVLWFLQVRVLNQDLEAWMPRMGSDSATLAFLKALTYTLTGGSGSRVFLLEAIRLDSTFIAPRIWLIPALVNLNEKTARKEAEEHYRALQSLKSGATPFELAMIELAECYLHGNLQCRVAALEKGLRFAPGNRIVLANLGLAYARLENFDQAAGAYEPVVRSAYPYPPVYPEYARALIRTKRHEEARTVLDGALAMLPVAPDTYNLLAAFAWKDGDSVKARDYELKFLESLTGRDKSWGDACESLSRALIDMGEPELAVRFLRNAVAEKPGIASPRSALARALVLSGDTARGEVEAKSTLTLNHGCVEAHALLGRLFLERGSFERARFHFQEYLKGDSVTVTALDLRRRLGAIESTFGSGGGNVSR